TSASRAVRWRPRGAGGGAIPDIRGSSRDVAPDAARPRGRQARTQDRWNTGGIPRSEDAAWRSSGTAVSGGTFRAGPLKLEVDEGRDRAAGNRGADDRDGHGQPGGQRAGIQCLDTMTQRDDR